MGPHLVGWRVGVTSFAGAALLVFIFNFVITIWAVTKHNPDKDGTGVIYEGSCSKVRSANTGVHLVINVLSIILLSGSNYCMQCLSAPTRADVDSAHAASIWLDIGIPSFRNLRWINSKRLVLWCLLGISSLPLHLFYNSSIFVSISASSYYFLVRGPDGSYGPAFYGMWQEARSNSLERLEVAACVDAYTEVFQSTRGNLFLISDDHIGYLTVGTPIATSSCGSQQSYEWVCAQYQPQKHDCPLPCDVLLPEVQANLSNWRPARSSVKYCLSKRLEEHCKLQFSATISWLVVGLNFLKFVLMCGVVFGVNEAPLMTIGDAISSFMKNPDITTDNMCLASKNEFIGRRRLWSVSPRPFMSAPQRRFAAASKNRWIASISIYIAALTLCCFLLAYGISRIRGTKNPSSLLSLGLGAVTARTIISSPLPTRGRAGILSNVFLANFPQLILSTIYFTYNALFTCMSVASEWSNFAERRKGLRVSGTPTDFQRTTYFLQLPYRLAIPLVFFSGILHWLFSQSILLVNVQIYRNSRPLPVDFSPPGRFITCGWSPIGIVCVIALGICMLLWAVGTGFRRLGTGIPVAASCSAAISAACHPSSDESDLG